jgi:hypothetical protein
MKRPRSRIEIYLSVRRVWQGPAKFGLEDRGALKIRHEIVGWPAIEKDRPGKARSETRKETAGLRKIARAPRARAASKILREIAVFRLIARDRRGKAA